MFLLQAGLPEGIDVTEKKSDRPTPGPQRARPSPGPEPTDSPGAKRGPRLHVTRRSAAWVVGAAVLVAATGAAGFVASSSTPRPVPKPAADNRSTQSALDAIVAQHPGVGRPISQLIKQGMPKPTYEGDMGRIGVPKNAKLSTADGKTAQYVPGSVNGAFNLLQLGALALWAGCPKSEAPIAAAIAAAESGGNPGAQGDISLMDGTWDWSQGLWQIRGLRSERGTGGLRDSLANAKPEKNAQAMYTISSGCTDWTPWSTFVSGAYLPYLGMSKTAVLAAQQFRNQTGTYPTFGGAGAPVTVPSPEPRSSRSAKPGSHHNKTKGKRHSAPIKHKGAQQNKGGSQAGVPKAGTSKAPVARQTSQAPAAVPTSTPAAPQPIRSVVSKVTSAVPTKIVPKPTKTKLPLPSVTSVVGKLTSAVPTILP